MSISKRSKSSLGLAVEIGEAVEFVPSIGVAIVVPVLLGSILFPAGPRKHTVKTLSMLCKNG